METKIIKQSSLTSDCFMIQFTGLDACKKCEYKNTEECGGGETLIKMKKEDGKESSQNL